MALSTSAAPYIALLSLIVSVVPGVFWLYRKKIRPKKTAENDQQETRRSLTPIYHTERQFPPTYIYLEEFHCGQERILQQDASAYRSYHISPACHRIPGYRIASLDHGSQAVSLTAKFPVEIHSFSG